MIDKLDCLLKLAVKDEDAKVREMALDSLSTLAGQPVCISLRTALTPPEASRDCAEPLIAQSLFARTCDAALAEGHLDVRVAWVSLIVSVSTQGW